MPETFWSLTLAEALLLLEHGRDLDKAAWNRASQEMALLYNINRGKARALKPADFTPYDQDLRHAPATEMTEELLSDLESFGQIMKHGAG